MVTGISISNSIVMHRIWPVRLSTFEKYSKKQMRLKVIQVDEEVKGEIMFQNRREWYNYFEFESRSQHSFRRIELFKIFLARRCLATEFIPIYKCPVTLPPTLVTRLCNSYSCLEPLIHPCHDHELLKQIAASEWTQYILGTPMRLQCWPNTGTHF